MAAVALHIHRLLAIVLATMKGAAAWNYAENGLDWGDLGLCAGNHEETKNQSPIDIPDREAPAEESGNAIWFKYPHLGRTVDLYNNGYSIAMTLPEVYRGGFGLARGVDDLQESDANAYRLWQVNFHSPSEHTVNGKRMPLEMQMMHQKVNGDAETAVVVVMFSENTGPQNEFLDIITGMGLPAAAWDEKEINTASSPRGQQAPPGPRDIGFQRLLTGSRYYQYTGSLTVPPCETQVKYFVRKQPVSATPKQLTGFREVLQALCPPKGNYRRIPPQSLAAVSLRMLRAGDGFTGNWASVALDPNVGADDYRRSAMAKYVNNDPAFRRAAHGDSEALRNVKNHYQIARLSYEGAKNQKESAKRQQELVKSQYDGAPGLVNKIDLKWQVIGTQGATNAAARLVMRTQEELEDAIEDAVDVLLAEYASSHPKSDAAPQGTTAIPTEAGSDGVVATTAVPYMEDEQGNRITPAPSAVAAVAAKPWDVLQYVPHVKLPRGQAASPFTVPFANAGVSIGAQGSISAARLSPNLRQPEGPPGKVPVASVIETTTPLPPNDKKMTMQMDMKLPIDMHTDPSMEDEDEFQKDFQHMVSESIGIPEDSVRVPQEVERPFTNVLVPTPPEGARLFVQRQSEVVPQGHDRRLRKSKRHSA